MTSFYDSYQNPWGCCCLVQIKAIVLLSSAELANLNNKAKTKLILVVVVKYRHRAIVLFFKKHDLLAKGFFTSYFIDVDSELILYACQTCFKRRATAVLSWLDCSSTAARH